MISEAIAQTPAGVAGEPNAIMGYLPLVAIFLVFYFLFIRPQNKRMKEHEALISELKRGDKVVTDSGLYGEISKVVDEQTVELIIAEGVKVKVVRHSVANVTNKTVEVSKEDKKKK